MKAIRCRLVVHGSFDQFTVGEFKSISSAKKYVSECVYKPYSIIRIKK